MCKHVMYVILSQLRPYPHLTSTFSIGDFYRGCGVCLFVVPPVFGCSTFYSISMVVITQGKALTVVPPLAKVAKDTDTRLQLIVIAQRSVSDLMSSSCYLKSIPIQTRSLWRKEKYKTCFKPNSRNVLS